MDLGDVLRERGVTQVQCARRLGVSEAAVSRWVSGERVLPLRQRLRAARVLGRIELALADGDVRAVAQMARGVVPLDIERQRRAKGEPRTILALLYPDGRIEPLPDPPGGASARTVA